jgi:hypothetical protein
MRTLIFSFLVSLSSISPAFAGDQARPSYSEAVSALSERRAELAKEWKAGPSRELRSAIEAELVAAVEALSQYWLGTRYGRGIPQTLTPLDGKINCGTFVGSVLRDVGFQVKVKKLQRQPSQAIIKSFVGGKRVRKFSNASMKSFLASVREMGPGLFIIGLDLHVGLLLQTEDDLRFLHASSETMTVVNEDAATATFITMSGYRVVGKILSQQNIQDWLRGDRIPVKGNK